MKRTWRVVAMAVAVSGVLTLACPVAAEVTVSVTLTGSVEELLPVLEHLNTLRGGQETASGEEGRVTIESVAGPDAQDASADELPEAAPVPRFGSVAATGSPATPGGVVLLTVQVVDPDRQVDTVAGIVESTGNNSFDFFDNGTHGDAIARDGVWSHALSITAAWPTGVHAVRVTAFDAFGAPVRVTKASGDAEILSATIPFMVGEARAGDPDGLTGDPAPPASAAPAPGGRP